MLTNSLRYAGEHSRSSTDRRRQGIEHDEFEPICALGHELGVRRGSHHTLLRRDCLIKTRRVRRSAYSAAHCSSPSSSRVVRDRKLGSIIRPVRLAHRVRQRMTEPLSRTSRPHPLLRRCRFFPNTSLPAANDARARSCQMPKLGPASCRSRLITSIVAVLGNFFDPG